MSFDIMIPARMASTRLPGKMLLDLAGKPVIARTYEQCKLSKADHIYILTDHADIYHAAKQFTDDVLYTSESCQNGTQRIIEGIEKLNMPNDRIIVNVQGDEPLILPDMINQVAQCLLKTDFPMATLAHAIHNEAEYHNAHIVKVVRDVYDCALYFSRSPLPWGRSFAEVKGETLRHIGIYAYQAAFLRTLATLPPSPLQKLESLEQLQVLWHGYKIYVGISHTLAPPDLNTQEDYEIIQKSFLSI